ncbi:MAG TPA: hypothetical protein VFV50_14075 [Bdellovibrionales bacterium]|nr:hypothetical protein [Bdellovibrionales bacterium]
MFLRLVLTSAFLMSVAGCTSSGGGANPPAGQGCQVTPGNACAQNVPICDASALNPFIPVGPASRVAALPAGSYRYIGGDVYAETTNLSPNSKVALTDNEPDNPAYPGTLLCVTNLSGSIPAFDTTGAISRNVQIAGGNFNLSGLRRLSASLSNGTLQTIVFSQNDFRVKTAAEMEQEQGTREAQGWSVNMYRVSTNEFKIVIVRSVSGNGINANLFIAARYSYIP